MEKISYSAHISNKKSAITSKAKLAGVAKHNLRKYHSSDYSQEEVVLLYGTDNLMKDVKRVYREEFDKALKEYNSKQTRLMIISAMWRRNNRTWQWRLFFRLATRSFGKRISLNEKI